ncbi:hypothetical protein AB0L65_10050 [Nonomuraea sp. NPDC052116]|uniref:hypothetical protein n=1 Tax=Nonomuraea sp. NPDC052116 TaxID=3155665 RepID=UPI003437E4B9
MDFGTVHALEETAMTRTGMIVGSPCWSSPEEYGGAATDIPNWALLIAYAARQQAAFSAPDIPRS